MFAPMLQAIGMAARKAAKKTNRQTPNLSQMFQQTQPMGMSPGTKPGVFSRMVGTIRKDLPGSM